MPAIDALGVWEQLATGCGEALNYYTRQYSHMTPNNRRKQLLEQGAADFDSKCAPGDEEEKSHYRADYYVSEEGYMKRHLEENLKVFRDCVSKDIPQPILFVDFGCGPMTAGLALAEILSKQTSGNRMQTAYFGVDASAHMIKKANNINEKHELFPKYFKVVQDTEFDAQKIPNAYPEAQTVLLSLSFVLAPDTLRQSDIPSHMLATKLADDWKRFIANRTQCQKTIIIYLNPVDFNGLNVNWLNYFRPTMLSANNVGDFKYTENKMKKLFLKSSRDIESHEVAFAMIQGTRQ